MVDCIFALLSTHLPIQGIYRVACSLAGRVSSYIGAKNFFTCAIVKQLTDMHVCVCMWIPSNMLRSQDIHINMLDTSLPFPSPP